MPGPDTQVDESALVGATVSLKLKPEDLRRALTAFQPLPLARNATSEEAGANAEHWRSLGIACAVVSHDDLHLEATQTKIRALECSEDSLTGITTLGRAPISFDWREVTLLVAGRLLSNRVEVEERGRGVRKQTVDSRHLSSDESVLDLYFGNDPANWRIVTGAFDFSCLGPAKAVTTFQNFVALIGFLRERAATAQFDDSYVRVRPLLESFWPLGQQVDKSGLRRSGAGKFDSATVTTTDNEGQFTRYSRLRYCLNLLELKERR
ncbi:MAG: hypothetical protein AABM67_07055 [Acidobacteriota bacterium]